MRFVVPELGQAGLGTWRLRGPGAQGSVWLLGWDAARGSLSTFYTLQAIEQPGEYWLERSLTPGEYHLDVRLDADNQRSYPFSIRPEDTASVQIELE